MALAIRERITENALPLLEPGEQIQTVIPAQTKNGWLGALGILWLLFVNRYRPIIVTDRRIAITDSGKWAQAKPTSIVTSLPRATQIGPRSVSGGSAPASATRCSSTSASTKTSNWPTRCAGSRC